MVSLDRQKMVLMKVLTFVQARALALLFIAMFAPVHLVFNKKRLLLSVW